MLIFRKRFGFISKIEYICGESIRNGFISIESVFAYPLMENRQFSTQRRIQHLQRRCLHISTPQEGPDIAVGRGVGCLFL